MGVNKLLQAGIDKENLQLKGGSAKKPAKVPAVERKSGAEGSASGRIRKRGGRPSNKELGLESRKQYSLTLKEDDYNLFLEKARENDLSFAKFMEKAAFEYIESHSTSASASLT